MNETEKRQNELIYKLRCLAEESGPGSSRDLAMDCVREIKRAQRLAKLDWFQNVLDWHKLCASERIGTTPEMPVPGICVLAGRLVYEEYSEFCEAYNRGDIPSLADAIGDLVYVLLGVSIAFGIDMRPVFNAIHAANMTKATGPVRADGKREKPLGFVPPDIAAILARQPSLESLP